jgi:hypothetical protein
MNQGNEGDEILLLALRQIDCPINENAKIVGELTQDEIIKIVVQCLWLISEGSLKVLLVTEKFPIS